MHVEVAICTESGLLATEFCPPETIAKKIFINRPEYIATDDNWRGAIGRVPADAKLMHPTGNCNIHTLPALGQPLNPTATYNSEGKYIQLTWQSGGGQIAGYLVYRKAPDDEDYKPLLDKPVNTYALFDPVDVEGRYSYRIYAVDANGVRSSGTTVNVSTNGETLVEPTPPETEPEPDNTPEQGNNGRGNNKKKD